jgi:HAD superfamily hydrolase (TIGR01450 family)
MPFEFNQKKVFVCDLDGTLFMGPHPIEPAVRFVIEACNSGRFAFYYLTNNTSKTPEAYLKKIGGAGIPVVEQQILTPLSTLESYIRERTYRSVYLVASEAVTAFLQERLPDVTFEFAPERNQLMALAFDPELTYEKLRRLAVLHNARPELDFVATHPDACCPSEHGPIPDVGGILALLKTTNGMMPAHVFGKPSPSLLAPVLQRFAREEIAVVGDRLYTDKAMADRAGVDFVCVLSGETTRASLATYTGSPPAVVVEQFGEIAAMGEPTAREDHE